MKDTPIYLAFDINSGISIECQSSKRKIKNKLKKYVESCGLKSNYSNLKVFDLAQFVKMGVIENV